MRGCAIAVVGGLILVAILGLVAGIAVPNYFDAQSPPVSSFGSISDGPGAGSFPDSYVHPDAYVHREPTRLKLALIGLPALFLLALLALLVVVVFFSRSRRDDPRRDRTETLEIQELHRGFERLSERIEALEAILMGRSAR